MIEQKNTLHRYAMQFGTIMGLYWIFKFILFTLGPSIPIFFSAFSILTFLVPFLGYYYVRFYRNKKCGGIISFNQAWIFTVFMFMYASLLTAVAHFIYFEYIGTDSLIQFYREQIINSFLVSGNAEQTEIGKQLNSIIKDFQDANVPSINMTMQFLTQNIFYCSMLAIPIALLVKKQPTYPHQPSTNNEGNLNE